MAPWLSALWKIILVPVKLCYAVFIFSLIFMGFTMVTMIGDHTLVSETVHLSPGEVKSYYLPPGMVWVHTNSDAPVNEISDALTGHSSSYYGMGSGLSGCGTPFGAGYTLTNPGDKAANVSLRISTGVMNPFGWSLYG